MFQQFSLLLYSVTQGLGNKFMQWLQGYSIDMTNKHPFRLGYYCENNLFCGSGRPGGLKSEKNPHQGYLRTAHLLTQNMRYKLGVFSLKYVDFDLAGWV